MQDGTINIYNDSKVSSFTVLDGDSQKSDTGYILFYERTTSDSDTSFEHFQSSCNRTPMNNPRTVENQNLSPQMLQSWTPSSSPRLPVRSSPRTPLRPLNSDSSCGLIGENCQASPQFQQETPSSPYLPARGPRTRKLQISSQADNYRFLNDNSELEPATSPGSPYKPRKKIQRLNSSSFGGSTAYNLLQGCPSSKKNLKAEVVKQYVLPHLPLNRSKPFGRKPTDEQHRQSLPQHQQTPSQQELPPPPPTYPPQTLPQVTTTLQQPQPPHEQQVAPPSENDTPTTPPQEQPRPTPPQQPQVRQILPPPPRSGHACPPRTLPQVTATLQQPQPPHEQQVAPPFENDTPTTPPQEQPRPTPPQQPQVRQILPPPPRSGHAYPPRTLPQVTATLQQPQPPHEQQVAASENEQTPTQPPLSPPQQPQVASPQQESPSPPRHAQEQQPPRQKQLPANPSKKTLFEKLDRKSLIAFAKKKNKEVKRLKKMRLKRKATNPASKEAAILYLRKHLPTKCVDFIDRQIKLQKVKPQGRRYDRQDLILTMGLQKGGRRARAAVSDMFILPSKKTLLRFTQGLSIEPGIIEPILEGVGDFTSDLEDERDCYAVLLWDELSIDEFLMWSSKWKKFQGFSDYGPGEETTKELADHALIFFVVLLRNKKVKFPVSYYFSTGTTPSSVLANLIEKNIRRLKTFGVKIKFCTCDQAPTNLKALEILKACANKPYFLIDGEEICCGPDFVHIGKCIVSMFRKYDLEIGPGRYAKIKHVEELLSLKGKLIGTTLAPKLTAAHIYARDKQAMKVKLAFQLVSSSVAASLNTLIAQGKSTI
ncbi:histone-lysine N-methyltransferase 2D-like isoform X2 [Neocloeon triangulifer]|uniref:histone-lysine N-methyltransferase 2D-like isoform X2 n=1 Tax=Neocloeon triangulifer TaxID=2078957 RepID=UPI00286F1009|nr:histone-lysine N-methyltransferase 2D-like isoform X2 [Neocloeon triangulifer]